MGSRRPTRYLRYLHDMKVPVPSKRQRTVRKVLMGNVENENEDARNSSPEQLDGEHPSLGKFYR